MSTNDWTSGIGPIVATALALLFGMRRNRSKVTPRIKPKVHLRKTA
jgi:hypothetical protein